MSISAQDTGLEGRTPGVEAWEFPIPCGALTNGFRVHIPGPYSDLVFRGENLQKNLPRV